MDLIEFESDLELGTAIGLVFKTIFVHEMLFEIVRLRSLTFATFKLKPCLCSSMPDLLRSVLRSLVVRLIRVLHLAQNELESDILKQTRADTGSFVQKNSILSCVSFPGNRLPPTRPATCPPSLWIPAEQIKI